MTYLIEFVTRDRSGITAVVTSTGIMDADTVIDDIEAGRSTYYVAPNPWDRARVRTLSVLGGAYLFANWDGSRRNNLHDLAHQLPHRVPGVDRGDAGSPVVSALRVTRAALRRLRDRRLSTSS